MLGVAYLYFYFFGMLYNNTNYNLVVCKIVICIKKFINNKEEKKWGILF